MAEQEPHAEQGSVQHTSNVETSFDELAKGLTNGTLSRRKALRMFGAALVGGMLASIPGVAWAARPEDAPRLLVVSAGTEEANREMGLSSTVVLDQQFCRWAGLRGFGDTLCGAGGCGGQGGLGAR